VEIRKPGAWERDSLVLVAFLSYTGARVSEALKATADDLMFDKGLIRIKGVKKAGTVNAPPEVLSSLAGKNLSSKYLTAHSNKNTKGYLLVFC